jgi:hypothetical protein
MIVSEYADREMRWTLGPDPWETRWGRKARKMLTRGGAFGRESADIRQRCSPHARGPWRPAQIVPLPPAPPDELVAKVLDGQS